MTTPLLEGVSLFKKYTRTSTHFALNDVSVALASGDRLGIVGESGSGKSTLIRTLVGLEKPTAGAVLFRGEDIAGLTAAGMRAFRKDVQLVAQDTSSSFDPRMTFRQSLRVPAQRLCGMSKRRADEALESVLVSLGVPLSLADRRANDVSGGQRQRFALARALVVEPALLICDEVVSALDVSVQATVLNLLREICDTRGAALMFVSHGLPATAFISDALVVMQQGRIVDAGTTWDVLLHSDQAYTSALREAYDLTAAPGSTSLPEEGILR